MEDITHLTLLEEYIVKGKTIDDLVENRLMVIFDCLRIYDDNKIKSEVIKKVGYEIDEIIKKIDDLKAQRTTTHFI